MDLYVANHSSIIKLVQQNNSYGLGKLLLTQSLDLEELDATGNSPLLVAAHLGFSQCVHALLQAGANHKQINVFGQNALSLATYAGNLESVKLLLAKWSYAEYTKSSLVPPLCVAAMQGDMRLVRLFSKLYPSPEHVHTVHDLNALALAMVFRQKEVERYLVENHPTLRQDTNNHYGMDLSTIV